MSRCVIFSALLLSISVAFSTAESAAPPVPAWRGKASGTAYLGPDVLWRPREWLIFNMHDAEGSGFDLTLTLRDMNTYLQGPTPLLVWVTGPDDQTLVRHEVADDGHVAGNERYRDGIYDPFADFRYRQWHNHYSPGGYPPDKERAPYLDSPEDLPARTVRVEVPAAGKGLYRVTLLSSWDHWVSITPDRPLATGVHPGPGPLYMPQGRFENAYFYIPQTADEFSVMTTEEIKPYNWQITVRGPDGGEVAHTSGDAFANFDICRPEKTGTVYRLSAVGSTTGACLSMRGVPALICPDRQTARLLHGGAQLEDGNWLSFHQHQRTLHDWSEKLTPEALKVDLQPQAEDRSFTRSAGHHHWEVRLGDIPELLASQVLDPTSPDYGEFMNSSRRNPADVLLAIVAAADHPQNPYYRHPGIVRRVLLAQLSDLRRLSPFFWYDSRDTEFDADAVLGRDARGMFSGMLRSGWYGLGLDSRHVQAPALMAGLLDDVLPAPVAQAWKRSFELWAGSRWEMHVGEVANQWTYNLGQLLKVWQLTGNPDVLSLIRRQARRITAPGMYGRLNPDRLPFDDKSSIGYGRDVDCGRTRSGYLPEQMGFDGQYTIEQVMNMAPIWRVTNEPAILDWWSSFYILKTHLTLPKWGTHTSHYFRDTCSPTDINFRTRYYTHKTGLPEAARQLVPYADLWGPAEVAQSPREPWPCLADASFVKNIDNKFYFIKTGGYYSVVYAGPRSPLWTKFYMSDVSNQSVRFRGYGGAGYGGWGWNPTKVGGLSAVFVENCGPTLLAQNHNVTDTNVVWIRRKTPVSPLEAQDTNASVTCSGYAQPVASFDAEKRVYELTEKLPHTPLTVSRSIRFEDDAIAVDLKLTAHEDVAFEDVYHALPYMADRRNLTYFDADLRKISTAATPEALLTPSRPRHPDPDIEEARTNLPGVRCRAFDVAADSGAGATVILDEDYPLLHIRPVRYRKIAAAVGSLNVPLPARLKKNQSVNLRYVIVPHQDAMTEKTVRRLVDAHHPGTN